MMSSARVIPHNDGAGAIDSVGEGVPTSRIGERVWLYETQRQRGFGTAAGFAVVPSDHAVYLRKHQFCRSSLLGVPAMTAHRCVFADGSVQGQTILVTVGRCRRLLCPATGEMGWSNGDRNRKSPNRQNSLNGRCRSHHQLQNRRCGAAKEITGAADGRGIDRVVDVNFAANLPVTTAVVRSNRVIILFQWWL